MRKTWMTVTIVLGALIVLSACKPSDKYVGDWYALSNEGEVKVHFSKEKVLTVKTADGNEETYDFNQNSTGFINNVRYFGIKMNGESYYVVFNDKKDEENAVFIRQTNHASDFEDVVGDIVFKMNRKDYLSE